MSPDSTSYPFMALAQQFSIPRGAVWNYAQERIDGRVGPGTRYMLNMIGNRNEATLDAFFLRFSVLLDAVIVARRRRVLPAPPPPPAP